MYIALQFTPLKTGLNGYYPTVSDILLNNSKRRLIQLVVGTQYKINFYHCPYEIKLL